MASKLEWNGKQRLDEIEKAMEVALDEAAEVVENEIRTSMPGAGAQVVPGTGGDGKVKAKFIPSNPGNPPGVRKSGEDSKWLQASITRERPRRLTRLVGTPVDYAEYLEKGTSKMPERPFLLPGLKASRKRAGRRFRKVLKQRANL